MFIHKNKGQSILEYAILLGVVIAALLIMQVFVKRGYQGGLKDSADKMGEQFSAGNTAIQQERSMTGDQTIVEEVATGNEITGFTDKTIVGTVAKDTYSYSKRSGSEQTMETKQATDAATQEKTRWGDYQTETVEDFGDPY
jgi:uncharacterized protein (UPF0333 family)